MAGKCCFFVYLLTNRNNRVMYVGMTNNLEHRIYEHKTKHVPGFTCKYNVNKLGCYEETSDIHAAIAQEKEIEKWRREKTNLLGACRTYKNDDLQRVKFA